MPSYIGGQCSEYLLKVLGRMPPLQTANKYYWCQAADSPKWHWTWNYVDTKRSMVSEPQLKETLSNLWRNLPQNPGWEWLRQSNSTISKSYIFSPLVTMQQWSRSTGLYSMGPHVCVSPFVLGARCTPHSQHRDRVLNESSRPRTIDRDPELPISGRLIAVVVSDGLPQWLVTVKPAPVILSLWMERKDPL